MNVEIKINNTIETCDVVQTTCIYAVYIEVKQYTTVYSDLTTRTIKSINTARTYCEQILSHSTNKLMK